MPRTNQLPWPTENSELEKRCNLQMKELLPSWKADSSSVQREPQIVPLLVTNTAVVLQMNSATRFQILDMGRWAVVPTMETVLDLSQPVMRQIRPVLMSWEGAAAYRIMSVLVQDV